MYRCVILCFGCIATLILWLIAIAAEAQGQHYGFQANTKRDRRTLSLFNLGRQIIKHGLNGRCKISLSYAYQQLEPCHMRMIGYFCGDPSVSQIYRGSQAMGRVTNSLRDDHSGFTSVGKPKS